MFSPGVNRIWPGNTASAPNAAIRAASLWFPLRLSHPWREACSLYRERTLCSSVWRVSRAFNWIWLNLHSGPCRHWVFPGFMPLARHSRAAPFVCPSKKYSTVFTIRQHLSNPLCYCKSQKCDTNVTNLHKNSGSPVNSGPRLKPLSFPSLSVCASVHPWLRFRSDRH